MEIHRLCHLDPPSLRVADRSEMTPPRARWFSACACAAAAIGAAVIIMHFEDRGADGLSSAPDSSPRHPALRRGVCDTIAGTVVWAESSEPVPNAWIQAWPDSGQTPWDRGSSEPVNSTITDAAGKFVLDELPEGFYTVTATAWAAKIYLEESAVRPNIRRVRLSQVPTGTEDVEIKAHPGCVIAGFVIREDAAPRVVRTCP